jgi:magnesium transporter
MSDRIEELEEKLAKESAPEIVDGIQKLRTRMLMFRRSVWPLREVVNELSREESALINEGSIAYLPDLYDHTVLVIDTAENPAGNTVRNG